MKHIILTCCLNALSFIVSADNVNPYMSSLIQMGTLQNAIYHEARGEPFKGQVVVGQVIINRVNHQKFPDTINDVVYQNKQFSYTRRNKFIIKEPDARVKSFIISLAILTNMYYYGKYKESMFYHACAGKHKVIPKWDWKKLKFDGKIGKHCFYSLRGNA